MKKLLILFLAVGLLAACNNKKGKVGDKTDKDTTTVTKDGKDDKDGKEPEGDKTGDMTVTGWPQAKKDEFLTSCITEAFKASENRALSETYCECMLGKLEAKYPDYKTVEALTEPEVQDFLTQYKDGCLVGR